jgi:hypothetical protein
MMMKSRSQASVDVTGGKLKGEDLAASAAGLGEKLVVGAAELKAADGTAKPGGGASMVAGAEVAGLLKGNDAARMEGRLVGGVGTLCVVA